MEEKIRQYVNYQFRFDKREDIDDLKEEIIGNLIDRYQDYLDKGKDAEEAYIEAIKSLGDFTDDEANKIPEEFSVKPTIPDILLMCGAILSIFGLLLTFFNGIVGTIVTAISILIFSGSAYYLYSYSQYVRKELMDIKKHNVLLQKIYKYIKTSFIFWSLSLSFIMASLVMDIITRIVLLDPMSINFETINQYLSIYGFIFMISLITFLLIFISIYNRLMDHYYLLTGTRDIKGKIKESYEFLYGKRSSTFKMIFTSKSFIPIVGVIMILPMLLFDFSYHNYNPGISYERSYKFLFALISPPDIRLMIIPLLTLIAIIVFMILVFINKLKKQWPLVISYYIFFIGVIAMYQLNEAYEFVSYISSFVGPYSLFMMMILSIILISRKIMRGKENIKDKF